LKFEHNETGKKTHVPSQTRIKLCRVKISSANKHKKLVLTKILIHY